MYITNNYIWILYYKIEVYMYKPLPSHKDVLLLRSVTHSFKPLKTF